MDRVENMFVFASRRKPRKIGFDVDKSASVRLHCLDNPHIATENPLGRVTISFETSLARKTLQQLDLKGGACNTPEFFSQGIMVHR